MADDTPWLPSLPLVRRTPYVDPQADDDEIWDWTMGFTRVVALLTIPSMVAGLALLTAAGSGPLSTLGNAVGFGLATLPLSTMFVLRGGLILRYPSRAVGSRIGERTGTVSSEAEAQLNGLTMLAVGFGFPPAILLVVIG